MTLTLRSIALTLPCRHCHAEPNKPCVSLPRGFDALTRIRGGTPYRLHHQVRYNDARRVLNDQAKLDRWNAEVRA